MARARLLLLVAVAVGAVLSPTSASLQAQTPPVALKGTLERIKVHGKSLEGNLMKETAEPEVSIYLPPSYNRDPARRYPVVYLLHGYTNSDLGYFGPEGRQLHVIAERVFGANAATEMILVMPNCMNAYGGCMYSNSVTAGDWEGYVAEDLVSYMDSHYRTLATRASRGLAGHSMGGYGTLRIAMKRPDVFSAIYALSSCCLNEGTVRPPRDGAPSAAESVKTVDEARGHRAAQGTLARAAAWAPNPANPPFYLDLPTRNGEVQAGVAAKWAANSPVAMLDQYVVNLKKYKAIALDIGLQDNLITSNQVFIEGLKRHGVAHTFQTYEGDHGNRIPQRLEEHVLPFFAKNLAFGAPAASLTWRPQSHAAPSPVPPGVAKPSTTEAAAIAEVLAVEQAMEAAVVRQDTAFLQRVLAPTFVFTHGDGWVNGGAPLKVDSKATWIEWVKRQPAPYWYRDLDHVQVELHGDIAITVGRYFYQPRVANQTAANHQHVWFERVYAKRNGQWQHLSHRTIKGPLPTSEATGTH
jgi:S-formylglutathione hydrolase FrmB